MISVINFHNININQMLIRYFKVSWNWFHEFWWIFQKSTKILFVFSRMFQSSTHSVKNAGRYFEQFVKVSQPKSGGSNQVKNLPASLYTSPKSKYNSYNSNGNGNYKNSTQKKWKKNPAKFTEFLKINI